MKPITTILGLITAFILILIVGSSCSEENKITAILGTEFSLSIGQTALIEGEGLTLKFVEVEEDSRCPAGVECVQAGQVTCEVYVNFHGATSTIHITQTGGSPFSMGALGEYNILYRVEPYPQAGTEIAKSDYTLMLTVKK